MFWSLVLILLAILFLELENRSKLDGLFGSLCLLCAMSSVFYAFIYVPHGIYVVGLVIFSFLVFLIWRYF